MRRTGSSRAFPSDSGPFDFKKSHRIQLTTGGRDGDRPRKKPPSGGFFFSNQQLTENCWRSGRDSNPRPPA